jgi:para-nitrobenzyl esterase
MFQDAAQAGNSYANAVGCGPDVNCLLSLSAARAIGTLPPDPSLFPSTAPTYQPVIGTNILAQQPLDSIASGLFSRAFPVPVLVGANADETAAAAPAVPDEAAYEALVDFDYGAAAAAVLAQYPAAAFATPRDAYVRVTTDSEFGCPARETARAAAMHVPVYRYVFAHGPAVNGAEVPYVFGNLAAPTAADLAISAAMQADWTSFARTGVPGGAPAWPAWDASGQLRLYGDAAQVGTSAVDCDFWQSM